MWIQRFVVLIGLRLIIANCISSVFRDFDFKTDVTKTLTKT